MKYLTVVKKNCNALLFFVSLVVHQKMFTLNFQCILDRWMDRLDRSIGFDVSISVIRFETLNVLNSLNSSTALWLSYKFQHTRDWNPDPLAHVSSTASLIYRDIRKEPPSIEELKFFNFTPTNFHLDFSIFILKKEGLS
jgi:hypothetical protein